MPAGSNPPTGGITTLAWTLVLLGAVGAAYLAIDRLVRARSVHRTGS